MKSAMDQCSIAIPNEMVIYGIGNLETAMNKIFFDSSGNALASIFRGLSIVTVKRSELILKTCITLSEKSPNYLKVLKSGLDKEGISETLAKLVLSQSHYLINPILKIIFTDTSGNALSTTLRLLNKLTDPQIDLVLKTCKTLAERSEKSMALLKLALREEGISEMLAKIVLFQSDYLFNTTMKIIFTDTSGNALEATFRRLNELPDERIGLILKTCEYFAGESSLYLSILKLAIEKKGISEELANLALLRSEYLFDVTMKIIFVVSSKDALTALFRGLDDVSERVEMVLKACKIYVERSKQFQGLLKSIEIKQDILIKLSKLI
jgi:hypothetical protein